MMDDSKKRFQIGFIGSLVFHLFVFLVLAFAGLFAANHVVDKIVANPKYNPATTERAKKRPISSRHISYFFIPKSDNISKLILKPSKPVSL